MINIGSLVNHLETYQEELSEEIAGTKCPARIEMLEDQETLRADRLYLGERLPDKVSVEPGTVVFLAGLAKGGSGQDSVRPSGNRVGVPKGAVLLRFSCSLARLYNSVAAALEKAEETERVRNERNPEAFRICWQNIADRRITGNLQIREAVSRTGFPLEAFVRPSVVTFTGDPGADSRSGLTAELQEVFPGVNIMEWQKVILLFLTYKERSFHVSLPEDKLNELLGKYDAWLCVGNGTRNLSALPLLFDLNQQASVLGRQLALRKGQRILLFEEYSVYCAIDLCAQHYMEIHRSDDIIYLVHPAVIHLTRYDMKHNTNLRDVLFYYLRNDRNLLKTAAETYMHRNTIINKVKKIQELVDLDLEDGKLRQRLIFSCQVIRYYENVMKQKLKL